ncbi:MAG: beta-lactamase family protein [Pseudomonadales bacterium]|nr:beta-lactamase family protein [Pseudomonadales bacterium]
MSGAIDIKGYTAPGFERVRKAFARNFDEDTECPEVGAAFSVVHEGQCVVDLYGGWADAARSRPWTPDTIVNTFSTTKGIGAICISVLEDRGAIDYDTPVAHYWPAFAAEGKRDVTVATALSHQAGLSGLRTALTIEDLFDWDRITALIAAASPLWEPGSNAGYHAITWGFLAGELVRRVAGGMTLNEFLQQELARPLDAQYHIGVPDARLPDVAEMIAPRGEPVQTLAEMTEILRLTLGNPIIEAGVANRRDFQSAELAALNGTGNARAIARLYAPFALEGRYAGRSVLSAGAISRAVTPRFVGIDMNLGTDVRWGAAGFFGNNPRRWYGPNPVAFGHSGWGGSMGYADPQARLSVGYVLNQMDANLHGDPRSMRLVDALYRSLEDL